MRTTISPDKKTAEVLMELLGKPSAPVSRVFIDRQLNRASNTKITKLLNDTLLYLHLVGNINRMFVDPQDAPELRSICTETSVYFWVVGGRADNHPGFFNAKQQHDKYEMVWTTKDEWSAAQGKNKLGVKDTTAPDREEVPPPPAPVTVEAPQTLVPAQPKNDQLGKHETPNSHEIFLEWALARETRFTMKEACADLPSLLQVTAKTVQLLLGRLVLLGKILRHTGQAEENDKDKVKQYWHPLFSNITEGFTPDVIVKAAYGEKSRAKAVAKATKLSAKEAATQKYSYPTAGEEGEEELQPAAEEDSNEADDNEADDSHTEEPGHANNSTVFDNPEFCLSDNNRLSIVENTEDGEAVTMTMPKGAVIRLKRFLNRISF